MREIEDLDPEHGCMATVQCIFWSMKVCKTLRENKDVEMFLLGKIEGEILTFKHSLTRLQDLNDQPIPLAYFNLLALLAFVYLPLSSFMLGFTFADAWGISMVGMLP